MNSCCELLSHPQTFACEKNTQKMLLPNCESVCVCMCVCVCVCVCVHVAPAFWGTEAGKPPFF